MNEISTNLPSFDCGDVSSPSSSDFELVTVFFCSFDDEDNPLVVR